MERFLHFLEAAGVWSMPVLWVPLLVWSAALVVTGPAIAAVRVNPLIRYRLAWGLLAALPVGLAGAFLVDAVTGAVGFAGVPTLHVPVLPEIVIAASPEPGTLPPGPSAWALAPGILTVVTAACSVVGLAGLIFDAVSTGRIRRSLVPVTDPEVLHLRDELQGRLGIRRHVEVLTGDALTGPASLGVLRPAMVLPRGISDDPAHLRLSMFHELIHIRRYDALFHLGERLLRAIFFIHPGIHWLCSTIDEVREAVCDAYVLAEKESSPAGYASLLYAFAVGDSKARVLQITMAQSRSQLKNRLITMKKHMHSARGLIRFQRAGLAAAIACFAAAVAFAACSDLTRITGPESPARIEDGAVAQPSAADDEEIFIVVEQMPELIGGLESLHERLQYPETARAEGAEGTVYVQFVVDREGMVTRPVVIRGVHPDVDDAALDAVKEARFIPGMQRGEPVPVRFSVPIRFRLGDEAKARNTGSLPFRFTERISNTVPDMLVGGVFDGESGRPLPGATVVLNDRGAATDAEGNFHISGVEPGEYTLRVTRPGFRPLEAHFVFGSGAYRTTYDLFLTPAD